MRFLLAKRWLFYGVLTVITVVFLFYKLNNPQIISAQNCEEISCSRENQSEEDYLKCNKDKQNCWESKINEARQSQVTLKNTINIINGQIVLQTLQIEQTLAELTQLQREVDELSQRIEGLSLSLDRLSAILIERIQIAYKQERATSVLAMFAQNSFNNFVQQLKYLQQAQNQTAHAMKQAEDQRLRYHEQKALKEQKQTELALKEKKLKQQQTELGQQKNEQQYLLNETKNNETKYQQELAKALAEIEAIQSIIAGRGQETNAGEVNEGDTIANIIVGVSACSTGTHLHFEVVKDGVHFNPANFLKPVDISWRNSPDGQFSFNGDWNWPVNDPAVITQGYGMTYYARVKRFYGGAPHSGIDLVSKTTSDVRVKAVKAGTLFRGSIPCGGGLLRYVKVEHKDSDYSTYYLHVNY